MPQENNQPPTQQTELPKLEGWQLDNFIFITDSLKGFKLGEAFNDAIYDGMRKGLSNFEVSRDFNMPQFEAVRDVNMSIPKEPVRFNLRLEQIETEAGKMHVLSKIDASLLKDGKPEVSATFRVYKKSGFTSGQMRNLLHDRTVAHNRISMKGNQYLAYTKLNIDGPRDEYGNSQLNSVPAFRQEYDAAKLLGKVLPNNYSQKEIEDVGRRLNNGDIVPIAKRGVGGSLEVSHLYSAPQEDALMMIDKNGEVKKITAPAMEVIRNDQSQSQQNRQGQGEDPSTKQDLGKGADVAKSMAESEDKPNNTRQRRRA